MVKIKVRKPSVRATLRQLGGAFLQWPRLQEAKVQAFERLARSLEKYLMNWVLVDRQSCESFASALHLALDSCDEPIYERPLVAEAYAYLHLLERYRRFWDVLASMAKAAVLPIEANGVEVLDVGTGPAPASYAVSDFYGVLGEYAAAVGADRLRTAAPHLECIEASRSMNHLVHILSELDQRSGPFGARFGEFAGFDPAAERDAGRGSRIRQIAEEDDIGIDFASWWVSQSEPGWATAFTYKLCIFSNFLTTPRMIPLFHDELAAVFRALRPGGVVVVVGGRSGHYPQVFSLAEELASVAGLRRMAEVPGEISCSYDDAFAQRIKCSYNRIWSHLAEWGIDLTRVPAKLTTELGDSSIALRGPAAFGLRVFRKGRW